MHVINFDRKTNTRHVLLWDDKEKCVNEELVGGGYGRVIALSDEERSGGSGKLQKLLSSMVQAGENAHKKHLGMYEYGDPYSDEEDMENRRGY